MKIDAEKVKAEVAIEDVIGQFVRLEKAGPGELTGPCPFHKETAPSFTVTPAKGMFYCFGCQKGGDVFDFVSEIEGIGTFAETVERVAELIGFQDGGESRPVARVRVAKAGGDIPDGDASPSRPGGSEEAEEPLGAITATYQYTDESGALLYEVLRIEPGRKGKKKDFLQRTPLPGGGWSWKQSPRKVLYNLPAVLAAEEVFIVEGEKDADTLTAAGVVATTNSGGAGAKWLPEYTESLAGKRVLILPDQDEPGKKRGAVILAAVKGAALEAVVLNVPKGKDVTDYVAAGGTVADLLADVTEARAEQQREELDRRGLLSAEEIVSIFEGGVNAFLDPTRRPRGLQTGFRLYDSMTLGLHPGELSILAARPAMGKTAMALNIAGHAAESGASVAVFSLEMSRATLLSRLLCSRARVDSQKFRSGVLDRSEQRRMVESLQAVAAQRLFIDDTAGCTLKAVHGKLLRLQKESGLDLVVIDYLQLMTAGKGENRNLEIGALSRGLKLMARSLKVPFLVLSQLSRAPEARTGTHRPQLSDLRESGSIEQDADNVAFIFRPEVYQPDREDLRGVAELILAKQRNGPIGKVPLVFLHSMTRFENAAEFYEAEDAA